jgi:hypothetical protein
MFWGENSGGTKLDLLERKILIAETAGPQRKCAELDVCNNSASADIVQGALDAPRQRASGGSPYVLTPAPLGRNAERETMYTQREIVAMLQNALSLLENKVSYMYHVYVCERGTESGRQQKETQRGGCVCVSEKERNVCVCVCERERTVCE